MLSTLLYISFSNTLNSQKHMHSLCSLLVLAQHLTPFSPLFYWRKQKQSGSTFLALNGTIIFWLADHNLFGFESTEPIPSPSVTANTGVPQGCVSFPLLYTFYTNDRTSTASGNLIVKSADDSAILSQLFAHSDWHWWLTHTSPGESIPRMVH